MKDRLEKTFLELVEISEVYPKEKEIIKYLESFFTSFGLDHESDSFGNLIAKIQGRGDPVMVNTHMDIPEPNPGVKIVKEGDIIRSDGNSILGADPKSGLATILEFLKNVKKYRGCYRPLELVFTRGEEAGLKGAKSLDFSLLDSKVGLVLDEDGPVTQVVIQAPNYIRMDVEFKGRQVHPRDPREGINALEVAGQAISKVSYGYSNPDVTWNIGILRAGTARNTVPGAAYLQAELRSYGEELVRTEADRIAGIFNDHAGEYGAGCQTDINFMYAGYKLESNNIFFQDLERTYRKMDLKPNYFATFGGSDANVFNENGILSTPIGSGYHNAHQHSEYVDLSEMEELERFLHLFCSN
ncbi:MAG: M20/M25/M40 family metallo-hydrolase [Candidatus Paceibacterota bacterium]